LRKRKNNYSDKKKNKGGRGERIVKRKGEGRRQEGVDRFLSAAPDIYKSTFPSPNPSQSSIFAFLSPSPHKK